MLKLTFLLVLNMLLLAQCNTNISKNWATPVENKNTVYADENTYANDSTLLVKSMWNFVANEQRPFQSQSLGETKRVQIDTIIYSSDFKKIVALIIHEYKNIELDSSEMNTKLEAFCFLGQKEEKISALHWFDYMVPGDYSPSSISDLSIRIREMYFLELAAGNLKECRYNMDDVRVWKELIWDNAKWIKVNLN